MTKKISLFTIAALTVVLSTATASANTYIDKITAESFRRVCTPARGGRQPHTPIFKANYSVLLPAPSLFWLQRTALGAVNNA